jgi:hypothetical protein
MKSEDRKNLGDSAGAPRIAMTRLFFQPDAGFCKAENEAGGRAAGQNLRQVQAS